jgi:myosin-7
MGDYTTKKQPYSITTKLFEIPLTLKSLRNEVYCQIIKQITHNKTYSSRERGWELLWLASGLFPSSDPFLQDELSCFVQANDRNMPQMAPDIYQRLSWMAQDGCGSRQYPPLMIEVNAIHLHQLQLFQTFYLPDESTQMVRITSITRSCDVVNEIGKMIGLQSSEGFGLVISAGDKVVTIDEESYLFDIIYHYTPDPAAQSIDNCFQFIFLKTHWINVNIGDDNKADISFYYHQELAKYSCGYHKLTFDEAALLGSYVYRATFGPEPFHLDPINDIIMDLIPQTIYAQNVSKDWPTSILQRFGQHSITTADEAKCNFLRYLSRWPTFASHIIKVKINLVESLVAINQYNMLIISSADQVR